MQLLSLPDEVLVKILIQLDFPSLNTLFGIPQIRTKIQTFFTIISDKLPIDTLSNIPTSSFVNLKDLDPSENTTATWAILFALNSPADETIIQKIITAQTKLNAVTFINKDIHAIGEFDEDEEYEFLVGEQLGENVQALVNAANINRLVQNISFNHITRASLCNLELNPAILHFPNLRFLRLQGCTSGNESIKFDFKSDIEIGLVGTCQSLMKSFDLEKYPKVLRLASDDLERIEKVNFGELTEFTIFNKRQSSDGVLLQLKNLELPKLNLLYVNGVKSLQNIRSSSIHTFHVANINKSFVEFKDLQLPKLNLMSISNIQTSFHGLHSPRLKIVTLNDSEVINDSVGQFPEINHLKCYNSDSWLENMGTKNLNFFETRTNTREALQLMCELEFPELLNLIMDCCNNDGDIYNFLTKSPKLTDLYLINSRNSTFLENASTNMKYLKNLKVDYAKSWSLKALSC